MGDDLAQAAPEGRERLLPGASRESGPRPAGGGRRPVRVANLVFIMSQLVARDFKIRYRNMSLGVLWSLANPLIMMLVLTFVFSRILPNPSVKSYPAFLLCGLVPYNFFSMAWSAGTSSVYYNAPLVKRVPMAREIIPLSAVLANTIHFAIQMALLAVVVMVLGFVPTTRWLLIPAIMLVELAAVSGLALLTCSFDVHLRDTRYFVESINLLLFWLAPIIYGLDLVPQRYRLIYQLNPLTTAIVALRAVMLEGALPPAEPVVLGAASSAVLLLAGLVVFGFLKRSFADYL